MVDFEDLELDEEVIFQEVTDMQDIKRTLKGGYGAIVSQDKRKGIYYSEERGRLYYFECEDEDLTTVENYELVGKEIEIKEAEQLISEYLKELEEEEERRKNYDNWLS